MEFEKKISLFFILDDKKRLLTIKTEKAYDVITIEISKNFNYEERRKELFSVEKIKEQTNIVVDIDSICVVPGYGTIEGSKAFVLAYMVNDTMKQSPKNGYTYIPFKEAFDAISIDKEIGEQSFIKECLKILRSKT